MDPEKVAHNSPDGLEIVTVKNGWIVYLGNIRNEMMHGCARICYVFQSEAELGGAIPELLTTGKYEGAESLPCEPAFIPSIDGAPGSAQSYGE